MFFGALTLLYGVDSLSHSLMDASWMFGSIGLMAAHSQSVSS